MPDWQCCKAGDLLRVLCWLCCKAQLSVDRTSRHCWPASMPQKGHSLGQWDAADGGHSHLCFACGLANLQELQAQVRCVLRAMCAVRAVL